MTKAKALLLASMVMVTGCSFIPRYQRPEAPVPPAYPGAGNTNAASATIPWNQFFTDARQQRLIGLALTNNRDLRAAALRVDQSQAQYRISRSALFPREQATAGFDRTRSGGITRDQWSASLGTTAYEVDLFGRVRSLNRQALEKFFATEEARRATQVSLVAEVATADLDLRRATQQMALAAETLRLVEESRTLNRAALEAGASNELDLRSADAQVELTRVSLLAAQLQLAEARNRLEFLLGQALPAELDATPSSLDDNLLARVPAGLPSELIRFRPDILQAEHTLRAAAATNGPLVQRITASGSLSALVSVDVGAQVSGKVIALHADFNAPVRKGQLVAEIDPTLYRATLNQAEGELAHARATLTLKQQNLARKNALFPVNAVSKFDLDVASAEVAQAEAQLTIRQAVVESARANVEFCRITAPVDGIVISRRVDLGQTVIAAMTTPVLFNIAQDITRMNINASVSEADIGFVNVGQQVEFTVDSYPEDTFRGKVAQVRKAPVTSQNVVTYETMITVDNPDQRLFPGMTADVAILVAHRASVTKVPNAALRYTPPEGVALEGSPPTRLERTQRLLYVPGNSPGQLRPVIIRPGISDGVETEVVAGLESGTPVITATRTLANRGTGLVPPPPPQTP